MKLSLFFILFFVFCSNSYGFSLNEIPNDNQIDDSTDYNFFSPNEDNVNDYFIIEKIKTGEIREAKFSVFNRWGNLVFEESPYLNKWNGKGNKLNVKDVDLPEGVYIYRLEYKFNEKTTTTLGKIILKR